MLKIIDDEIARAEKNEKENPDEEERKTFTEVSKNFCEGIGNGVVQSLTFLSPTPPLPPF